MCDTKRPVPHTVTTILILLAITLHSFFMNGFFHASRFLNVATYTTPLVAESDPSLFQQSLYVQSLKEKSARLSLMHDLMPSLLRHIDLETFALIQWLICLLLTVCALFYLGKTFIGTDCAGYATALLFSTKLNDWTLGSPAIYINFFHHGLQWAIALNIFSLSLMFRKRLPRAFLLMGIAWNFHPMSVMFLFFLFVPYWIFHRKEIPIKTLLLCAVLFALPALPMLIKSFTYLTMTWDYGPEWMTAVKWTAWYTLFPSTWSFDWFFRAGLYCWLFVMGLAALPASEKKRDTIIFVVTVGVLCVVGSVCAELVPLPFIMKMSLWRTSWLYIILSLPCIAHLLITLWDPSLLKRFIVIATLIVLTGYIHYFPYYYLFLFNIFFLLSLCQSSLEKRWPWLPEKMPWLFAALLLLMIFYQSLFSGGAMGTSMGLAFVLIFLSLLQRAEKSLHRAPYSRSWMIVALLFILAFDAGILVYRGGPDIYYHGHIRGERDPWADIQIFAKEHSEKDDVFIVPPSMNDFGLYSDRATLGDWAEGANILYMDNTFARAWLERMNDLGWYTLWGETSGYDGLSTEEIVTAAKKYGVRFIITKKPKHFELPRIYENSQFILYATSDSRN